MSEVAYGTSECPICGKNTPHSHPELEQKGYIIALHISNEVNRRGMMPLHELAKLCSYHLSEYQRTALVEFSKRHPIESLFFEHWLKEWESSDESSR